MVHLGRIVLLRRKIGQICRLSRRIRFIFLLLAMLKANLDH